MPMPDVALRGMSPVLHQVLKKAAERNHRSLNGEILVRLEDSVGTATVDVEGLLARIRERKERLDLSALDDGELRGLKESGRL